MRFKAIGGALFAAFEVSAREAANVGCPGATHRIVGPNTGTTIYGTIQDRRGGAIVKVPDMRNVVGRQVQFVTHDAHPAAMIGGHLIS